MKEQYIRQVKNELHISAKAKKEIVRDLNEIFSSAMEHGENEQQVIERLGTPKEFADSTAEQFGIDNAATGKRKEIISFVVALLVAITAFIVYGVSKIGKAPEGAIGQADAMTSIQIEGAFAFNASQVILAVGIIAVVLAAIQMILAARKSRR